MTRDAGASAAAARWIAGLRWEDVPRRTRDATLKAVLNSIGTGAGGFGLPVTRIALDMAHGEASTGPCTILVDGARVPPATALLVNGVMFNALGQEETHPASGTHPLQVTVPVALALAERRPTRGVEVLEAVLAGVETAVAFGRAEYRAADGDLTVQTAAVYGALGAAATAARLLGLDAGATAHALGIAANLGSGLIESVLTATDEYHYAVGDAARNGYLAAQLAAHGADAAATTFEGAGGFFGQMQRASSETLAGYDLAGHLERTLGSTWGIAELLYKPYPVHFNNVPFIDAARTLRERHALRPQDIRAVALTINRWCELCNGGNLGPYARREEALGATAFSVAAMLARARVDLGTTEDLDAPDILALVARTTVDGFATEAQAGDHRSVRVAVEVDGDTHVYASDREAPRDYDLPLHEIRDIARTALARVLHPDGVEPVIAAVEDLERADDAGALVALLVRRDRDA